jgi:hypothetical protein
VINDWCRPGGCADLICDHYEYFVVVCALALEKLLSDGLGLRVGVGRKDRGSSVRDLLRPDGDKSRTFVETKGYAARVDKEVELATAESGDPVEPLDASCEACAIDSSRGKTGWGEGETAAARAAEGFFRCPCGGIKGRQVSLEDELQLYDGGSRVRDDEGASEKGDSVGKGD